MVDGEDIGKKAGMLKRSALAISAGGCLTNARIKACSCMIKTAPHIMPPRLFPDEPMHVSPTKPASQPPSQPARPAPPPAP